MGRCRKCNVYGKSTIPYDQYNAYVRTACTLYAQVTTKPQGASFFYFFNFFKRLAFPAKALVTLRQNLRVFRGAKNPKIIIMVTHKNRATKSGAENRGKSCRHG